VLLRVTRDRERGIQPTAEQPTRKVIGRREIPIGRHVVYEWLKEYDRTDPKTQDLDGFLYAKLEGMGLIDTLVDMGEMGEMRLLDIIMEEVGSYRRER
jgi:hypothetical protein